MNGKPSVLARLAVKAVPRAARTEIAGWSGDRLRIRIAAVPENGKANAELERFLAAVAGIPRRDVRVAAGRGSTLKLVEFAGLEQSALDARLPGPAGAS